MPKNLSHLETILSAIASSGQNPRQRTGPCVSQARGRPLRFQEASPGASRDRKPGGSVEYQIIETDRKKREELGALLETRLEELRRAFLGSRTFVPDKALEDLRPSVSHEIRLSIHHPHLLVIEEATRSGLSGVEQTAGMLVLARDMRAHNLYLREATSLEPHMDRTWTHGLQRPAESGHEEFFRLHQRYARAARRC
jgi:hypothetical protein